MHVKDVFKSRFSDGRRNRTPGLVTDAYNWLFLDCSRNIVDVRLNAAVIVMLLT